MRKKIMAGFGILALVALNSFSFSAAAQATESTGHTGYYVYVANDYNNQSLAYEVPGNTVAVAPNVANLPCGTWSVQADWLADGSQPFPSTLHPDQTPLRPQASAHYFNVTGTKDCTTPTPTPTPTHTPGPPPVKHHHHNPPTHHSTVSHTKTLAYTGATNPEWIAPAIWMVVAGVVLLIAYRKLRKRELSE